MIQSNTDAPYISSVAISTLECQPNKIVDFSIVCGKETPDVEQRKLRREYE